QGRRFAMGDLVSRGGYAFRKNMDSPCFLLRAQPQHAVRGHWAVETLQRELAHRLDVDQLARRRMDPLADQDLAAGGLGAQARRDIGHRADGAVIEPSLEADRANGGEALLDADAGAQPVTELPPA